MQADGKTPAPFSPPDPSASRAQPWGDLLERINAFSTWSTVFPLEGDDVGRATRILLGEAPTGGRYQYSYLADVEAGRATEQEVFLAAGKEKNGEGRPRTETGTAAHPEKRVWWKFSLEKLEHFVLSTVKELVLSLQKQYSWMSVLPVATLFASVQEKFFRGGHIYALAFWLFNPDFRIRVSNPDLVLTQAQEKKAVEQISKLTEEGKMKKGSWWSWKDVRKMASWRAQKDAKHGRKGQRLGDYLSGKTSVVRKLSWTLDKYGEQPLLTFGLRLDAVAKTLLGRFYPFWKLIRGFVERSVYYLELSAGEGTGATWGNASPGSLGALQATAVAPPTVDFNPLTAVLQTLRAAQHGVLYPSRFGVQEPTVRSVWHGFQLDGWQPSEYQMMKGEQVQQAEAAFRFRSPEIDPELNTFKYFLWEPLHTCPSWMLSEAYSEDQVDYRLVYFLHAQSCGGGFETNTELERVPCQLLIWRIPLSPTSEAADIKENIEGEVKAVAKDMANNFAQPAQVENRKPESHMESQKKMWRYPDQAEKQQERVKEAVVNEIKKKGTGAEWFDVLSRGAASAGEANARFEELADARHDLVLHHDSVFASEMGGDEENLPHSTASFAKAGGIFYEGMGKGKAKRDVKVITSDTARRGISGHLSARLWRQEFFRQIPTFVYEEAVKDAVKDALQKRIIPLRDTETVPPETGIDVMAKLLLAASSISEGESGKPQYDPKNFVIIDLGGADAAATGKGFVHRDLSGADQENVAATPPKSSGPHEYVLTDVSLDDSLKGQRQKFTMGEVNAAAADLVRAKYDKVVLASVKATGTDEKGSGIASERVQVRSKPKNKKVENDGLFYLSDRVEDTSAFVPFLMELFDGRKYITPEAVSSPSNGSPRRRGTTSNDDVPGAGDGDVKEAAGAPEAGAGGDEEVAADDMWSMLGGAGDEEDPAAAERTSGSAAGRGGVPTGLAAVKAVVDPLRQRKLRELYLQKTKVESLQRGRCGLNSVRVARTSLAPGPAAPSEKVKVELENKLADLQEKLFAVLKEE
eukprot:g12979.t1